MGVPGLLGSENCICRPQSACAYKLGTQTISWVRATVLGSGERGLWGGSEAEDGSPPSHHPLPFQGGCTSCAKWSQGESPASLVVSYGENSFHTSLQVNQLLGV